MDLTPFKLDIDELLDEFVKCYYTTLADMKRIWLEKKFSFIFEARPSSNSAFFMQSLYAHSLSHMVSDASLSQRLGGLYCLYCLYETQPYRPCFKIYLSLGELENLRSLVVEAKENGIAVVPALVRRMLLRNMFLFGYVDIVGGFVAQRVDELTKQQNKASQTAYENLFRGIDIEHYLHLDLVIKNHAFYYYRSKVGQWYALNLKETMILQNLDKGSEIDLPAISKMSAEYIEAKEIAIREAKGKVNLEDSKHIVESRKSLGDTLNDVVGGWEMQKDAFYQQTGTTRPDPTAASDDFAELDRLLNGVDDVWFSQS